MNNSANSLWGVYIKRLFFVLSVLILSSCASVQENGEVYDPFEPTNRVIFSFNDSLDTHIMRPIANTYLELPELFRKGVNNILGNLGDVVTLLNDILQLKLENAVTDMLRISFNTTFGLGGVFDIATEMQLEKNNERFGDTLGYWGVGPGPYLVLPLFGPSNLRDAPALFVDNYTSPISYIEPVSSKNIVQATSLINKRANIMKVSNLTDGVSFDPYNFQRDSFLQYRLNAIHDGNPPQEIFEDFEDFEDLE